MIKANLKTFLILLVLLPFNQVIAQKNSKIDLNGFVRNYSGVLTNNGDFSIVQNTLDLTLKYQKDELALVANPFIYQYPNKDNTIDLRELYIDFYTKKTDIRVGKQQIIWGQADGVFITDIVSPKNLTEFLLWDFNEIRLGVTAVKIKYYPKPDHDIELVWIPIFTPTIAPENGSIWSPKLAFPVQPTFDMSQKNVSATLSNSEAFVKYTLSKSAIDLQIMAGYTWDDDPNFHITKEFLIDSATMRPSLKSLNVTPTHHRLTLGGASFSTEIKGFILRGEGAFYKNKYFQTQNPTATDALVKKDYINYVVGLDRVLGDWRISGQFIQKSILDYDDYIQNDKIDNLATLMVNRTLMKEKLRLELFSYLGFNNADAFVRFRAFYFPSDGASVELGTNIFTGNSGIFGQYDNNDMIYTRVKYSF